MSLVCEVDFLKYNVLMNKRAKKRMKEAIQKEIAERAGKRNEQGASSPSKKLPESRGFTPRPDKKRG
jgi:hypothetical protein